MRDHGCGKERWFGKRGSDMEGLGTAGSRHDQRVNSFWHPQVECAEAALDIGRGEEFEVGSDIEVNIPANLESVMELEIHAHESPDPQADPTPDLERVRHQSRFFSVSPDEDGMGLLVEQALRLGFGGWKVGARGVTDPVQTGRTGVSPKRMSPSPFPT